jgi:hypothetical protein
MRAWGNFARIRIGSVRLPMAAALAERRHACPRAEVDAQPSRPQRSGSRGIGIGNVPVWRSSFVAKRHRPYLSH